MSEHTGVNWVEHNKLSFVSRGSILFPPGWLVGEHQDSYIDQYVVDEHTG